MCSRILLNLTGPGLKIGRQIHSCGMIRTSPQNHQMRAIVVGGDSKGGWTSSVETLDPKIGNSAAFLKFVFAAFQPVISIM
jgi:hypothetical protein